MMIYYRTGSAAMTAADCAILAFAVLAVLFLHFHVCRTSAHRRVS